MRRFDFGGGKRSRTAGLRIANASLYQLSYTPTGVPILFHFIFFVKGENVILNESEESDGRSFSTHRMTGQKEIL